MAKYTLDDVRAEYDRLDKLCGVSTAGVTLRISTKATRRYGLCHHKWQRDYSRADGGYYYPDYIAITDFVFDCENEFWDVIRHEYAHALVMLRDGRNHGHDAVWKAACREVGCRPERCSGAAETAQKVAVKKENRYKYQVVCEKCGASWRYMRATKVVQALQKGKACSHPACGSKKLRLIYL